MSFDYDLRQLERRLQTWTAPVPTPRAPLPTAVRPARPRSRTRHVRWLPVPVALVAIAMVVAAAGLILSNAAHNTGFLEDHPLLFLPDQTKPTCGQACAFMTLMQNQTGAFNFSVLNRVNKQYDYAVHFDFQTQNVNITWFVAEFFSISQDGSHTRSPLTVSWLVRNETVAQGVAYGLHINELDTQWYSLQLTLGWTLQGQYLDGAYLLNYWAESG